MKEVLFTYSADSRTYHAVIEKNEQNQTWYSWLEIHDGSEWWLYNMLPALCRFDAINAAFHKLAWKALGMKLYPCRAWMLYDDWQNGTDCYHMGQQVVYMRRISDKLFSLYVLSPRDGKVYNHHVEGSVELLFDDVTA